MLRELRQAARGLTARPWLTLVIVMTLALGVGANEAVFSVIDALLLRPSRSAIRNGWCASDRCMAATKAP